MLGVLIAHYLVKDVGNSQRVLHTNCEISEKGQDLMYIYTSIP